MTIIPYDKNAKSHPQEQLKLIASSIRDFGWQQPIKVGKGGIIIVGHGRFEAYNIYKDEFKLKEPWVINENGETISGAAETRKLTTLEERDYRLRDNKISESEWLPDLLLPELKELELAGLDIELMGFSRDLVPSEKEGGDSIPSLPKDPQSKLGDIYVLGEHRVICGDSSDPDLVDILMTALKPDMVFTDPPYGIGYQDTKHKHDLIEGDETLENIESLMAITLTNNCPMYICCNWKSYSSFEKAMKDAGKDPKSCIVWDKETRIQNLDKFYKQHEFILYHGLFGGQKTLAGDVWRIKRETRDDHPTAKPVELIVNAITYSILPKQIVQDLFLGSGSTLIAAEKTGRRCFGMEIDPKYVDVIVQRWVDFTGIETVYRNGEIVEWLKS